LLSEYLYDTNRSAEPYVSFLASLFFPSTRSWLFFLAHRAKWGAYGFEKMVIFVGVCGFASSIAGVALHLVSRYLSRKDSSELRGRGKAL
jgi:hypothetical protein